MSVKTFLHSIIPPSALAAYHRLLAVLAAIVYRHPANHLVVIGVTGTKGKSTTVFMIAHLLENAGFTVGATSTALFKIGKREWLNATKMTMQGRFRLQQLLHTMKQEGCSVAIVETSSEGIKQFRHIGINYDVAVFTNLTPEHIESHGSFEAYRQAKEELFKRLSRDPHKKWEEIAGAHEGRTGEIPKVSIVNRDSNYSEAFLKFSADRKVPYSLHDIHDVDITAHGSRFTLEGVAFHLPGLGRANLSNALAAITICRTVFGIDLAILARALDALPQVPGRFERIDEGQPFTVIVDYAHEPESTKNLYETIAALPHDRVIHVTGSAGGGRDTARRPLLGEIAAENADIVIVTNEDPYDENPMYIINAVAWGAVKHGKRDGETLFRILDRREAIQKAFELARPRDLVLITGKGSEQAMVVKGKHIPWDDRRVAREELHHILH